MVDQNGSGIAAASTQTMVERNRHARRSASSGPSAEARRLFGSDNPSVSTGFGVLTLFLTDVPEEEDGPAGHS
jgi:hypothetical protein